MASKKVKLKPCPFCGELGNPNFIFFDWVRGSMVAEYYVYCRQCRAAGPPASTPMDAVRRWDRRAKAKPETKQTKGRK